MQVLDFHTSKRKKVDADHENIFSENYILQDGNTAIVNSAEQKMKFFINGFCSKCDQIQFSSGFGNVYWRNPQS